MVQTQTQPVAQQPVVNQAQPIAAQPAGQMQLEEETSILKKWWFWVIVGLVIIGIGVGVYFLFF